MCISQYSAKDARWNNLEDISILKMSISIPNYYSRENSINHMNEFFERMEERMVIVYS